MNIHTQNNTFILFGDNTSFINNYCPSYLSPTFNDITKDVLTRIYQNNELINIDSLDSNKIIAILSDLFPNIPILPYSSLNSSFDVYSPHNKYIVINEKGLFESLVEKNNSFYFTDYQIADDQDGFLLYGRPSTLKNNINLGNINLEFMSTSFLNFMINKYNLFYEINQKVPYVLDKTKPNAFEFEHYLNENYSYIFDGLENLALYLLPFHDFCVYCSIINIVPDMYIDLNGKIHTINETENFEDLMKNILKFVNYMKNLHPNCLVTIYNYH